MSRKKQTVETSPSDEDLAARCRRDGCADSFEVLMVRHQEKIHAVIHRFVRDDERSLDLTQETFMRAWRGMKGFEANSAFYTWLYRIARNVVHSEHRRVMARPRVVMSLDHTASGNDDGTGFEIADPRSGPDARLIEIERRERLLAAVDELVDDFREVIVLRDIEEYSYEDMAEMLEIPIGTVRSRLHRARSELRALVERTR